DFDEWLKQQTKRKESPMSALDVALISKGAKKEWLDKQRAAAAKDTTGRKDFLTRPAAFVV
ncbi:MAG TPA: hypothetical protein VNT24_06400, partial [Propionibacteriaceae bacterium]|nr:hypothetical protein [Propionibacteriaceae bacterium]